MSLEILHSLPTFTAKPRTDREDGGRKKEGDEEGKEESAFSSSSACATRAEGRLLRRGHRPTDRGEAVSQQVHAAAAAHKHRNTVNAT